ncbi:hypothetical protein GMOD_00000438 [Pyrenophora seminiperda CCB06]|uniref:Uncharacterized protein n=1 Tax=Pyrenophora seminiperda CCB06 TaxID=1302712 RepID=A0A3M7M7B0_9PLEO|nr:hypothetical protein GMOD_00000438 [Pyrenophora seminiperda CCB06]
MLGELSASLGLPDIERRSTTNDPSAQSHGYRASEAKPNFVPGLDGGLIGRALSKPMTANYLAQYLSGLNVQQGQGTPPQGSQGSQDSPSTPLQEGKAAEEQATKIVQPPPGFDSARARKIRAAESSAAAVNATARAVKGRPRVVPTGPFAMRRARGPSDLAMHCSPSPSNTSQSLEQLGHARNISGGQRHRPRAYTRTKRTDQGPEPSAADIYPDDANYTPRRPSNPLEPAGPFPFPKLDQTPQSHFSTGDRVSWPTPVEVYTLKPQKPQTPRSLIQLFEQQYGDQAYVVAPPPVPFDIFADHSYPSQTDLKSADGEVTALLSSIPTLFRQQEDQIQAQDQDIVELSCDTRSLTPQQLTGARYGLRHFGIGLGDTWICPEVKEGEPFRVRPRNHDGWGSWEWAIRKGWGEE